MFRINWQKEIFTIPNLLSLFRIALLPVYVSIYLGARETVDYLLAGALMGISCLTDLVDGKIARKFNMITNVGKVLDPLADKLTQLTLSLCLSLRYPVLYPVVMLLLTKEIFQVITAIAFLRRGKALPGAIWAGKVCTTVLFLSLIALVIFPQLPVKTVDAIAVTDSCFLALAFVSYIFAFFGKHTKVQDLKSE